MGEDGTAVGVRVAVGEGGTAVGVRVGVGEGGTAVGVRVGVGGGGTGVAVGITLAAVGAEVGVEAAVGEGSAVPPQPTAKAKSTKAQNNLFIEALSLPRRCNFTARPISLRVSSP